MPPTTTGARRLRYAFMFLWVGLALAPSLRAQGLEYVEANYTKYEFRVPTRDGKRLFTNVYVPKDDSKRYPILLMRTPYSVRPYGIDTYPDDLGPSPLFGRSGYIFASQDVRGRWMSEGEFVHMTPHLASKKGPSDVDESTDTYDTIEFLLKNVPNHNGRVGQSGISYPGFYTAAGMIDAHPALKASSPQAPVTDWFVGDDWHHNGALMLPHVFNFMAAFDHPRPRPTSKFTVNFDTGTPDGYRFFLKLGSASHASDEHLKEGAFYREIMEHGTYDEFWKKRNLRAHLKSNKVQPAVMTVGGWFDAENLFGALECYKAVEAGSPGAQNLLVMGPWVHGGWSRGDGDRLGDVHFNAKTSQFYRDNIEFPFFEFHLKGNGEFKHPEAWVFETGRNQWRKFDAWPPKGAKEKSLYLADKGALAFDPPGETGDRAFDEFVSDPDRPVPFINAVTTRMDVEYMIADQRFASTRPDVLVYQTEPLEEDLNVVGPLKAELTVSTTGTDSDWVVKLIDVYPDKYPDPPGLPAGRHMGGYQQLVRGDVMRGKFRDSFEKPEPFEPGKPTAVNFTLPDVDHTFRPGHRIMVQVQSSWFPLVDRNPQTFTDIYHAGASDYRKATQRVYRGKGRGSRLNVLVTP